MINNHEFREKSLNNLFRFYYNKQTDRQKAQATQKDIEKLKQEIDDYTWDFDLSQEQETNILQMYQAWKSAFDKKIFLSDLVGSNHGRRINVIITDRIKIDGLDFGININQSSTLYFHNCKNVIIQIKTKVNHITLEECSDITLKINNGSISGLDSIRCQNVLHVFSNNQIYYIDISNSNHCSFY